MCNLFRLIFIALQNVGVISAVPCINTGLRWTVLIKQKMASNLKHDGILTNIRCKRWLFCLFSLALRPHVGHGPPHFLRFLDHTQRRTTVGRTPLDEWSARRRDLYLINTQHSQQTNIHAPGGIQTHNFSKRAVADRRLRPRGYWHRHAKGVFFLLHRFIYIHYKFLK